MDIFIEEMVKKTKTTADKLLAAGVIVLAVLLIGVLFLVVGPVFTKYGFFPMVLLLMVGVGYGAYVFVSFQNKEFEYSLVNSALDVDKIFNKKLRRRVTSVNLYELEAFGTLKNPEYEGYKNNPRVKKLDASRNINDSDTIYFVYTAKSVKTMLLFSPSDRIVNIVKKLYPKKELV